MTNPILRNAMLRKSYAVMLAILTLLFWNGILFSAELTFDKASGNLSGLDIGINDSDYNPSNYPTKGEVWSYAGFVGRFDYRGEPARMTITNSGPIRSSSPNDKFYFTDTTDGSNPDHYREFFIVARAKGLLHEGNGQQDFNGKNFVVESSGDSFIISRGAGPEPAVVGEIGYNTSGGSGTYLGGSNQYAYKYPYSYIWIDIILIRTNQNYLSTPRWWWGRDYHYGYYETSFTATTQNLATSELDVHYTVQLSAQYNQTGSGNLWEYYFGIENLLPPTFPFSNLATKNSSSNTLTVGKVRYFSSNDTASLKFASNAAGTQTNFLLSSPGVPSFAYSVVYAPTRGQAPLVQTTITSSTGAFNSINTTVGSPIGGSNTGNYIEGEVRIFVAPNLLPLSGTYTSNIYCILTRTN